MISIEQIDHLLDNNGAVIDSNGDKVGKVEQAFVGDTSHEPQWVTAKTGLFGHSETFIPLAKASIEGSNVRVPYEKAMIKDAPRTENKDGHLEPSEEAELYRYYGLTAAGSAPDDGTSDAGGNRLRKYAAGGQAKSEGFGENRYDQLSGPQSDDLEHPRGTAEESHGAGGDHEARRDRDAEHRSSTDEEGGQAKSEGFGENRYDQLTGPQSEDLEHPLGTAEEGKEEPFNTESHGRHAR